MNDIVSKYLARVLLHPLAIFLSIIAGSFYGWWDHGQSELLQFSGKLYVKLLQMCVIPLLITAVVTSLSRLFSHGTVSRYVLRITVLIITGLLIAGITGAGLGTLGHPGLGLDNAAKATIGEVIMQAQASSSDGSAQTKSADMLEMVANIVPENIFSALTSGNKLAILFFTIFLGIGLGSVGKTKGDSAIVIFEILYATFIKIIEWLMYALPFGLFCLAYGQSAAVGISTLIAMARLVSLICIGALGLIILNSVIIWLAVGDRYWASVSKLRESMFVALGTGSSFAAVPAALRGLKEGLKLDKSIVDLVLPLGITLNPPGTVFHFAISTLFLANIYGMHLSILQIMFVVVSSVLAGVAASGAPGVAALSMISIILMPLGLPVEVAVVLLVAIDPIVDPILTVLNVQSNAALTSVVASISAREVQTNL